MKKSLLCFLFLFALCRAQEETLDPSIFDGTGKQQEAAEPKTPSVALPTQTPEEQGAASETPAPSADTEASPAPTPSAETPREIVLPGSGFEEEKPPEGKEPAGVPAASGGGKSRAGETVDSTEKIPTGQAVDFPWDM